MKIVRELPRRVREIENLTIPMGDGVRLAARVWLPADANADPVPAIVEMIPYRKRDGTAARDAMIHPYLAGHGYACLRIDLRGTGDSDGLLLDEYLPQEQSDAREAQAAIELEASADWSDAGAYPFDLQLGMLDPKPAIRAMKFVGNDSRMLSYCITVSL